MTFEEAFYLMLFILFIVYIWTPAPPKTKKIRLGDFLMEHLPCSEKDKVNLIKWIIVLHSRIPVQTCGLIFKGPLFEEALLIAKLIDRLFDGVSIRGYHAASQSIYLTVSGRTSLFPIPITLYNSLISSSNDEFKSVIGKLRPKDIIWPVKVVEGQGDPIIHHKGEK